MNRLKFTVLLFSIFVSSFAVLTFEISLTRIFSVMYSYHYTFLAVSAALFGLSLGGVLTQAFSWKMSFDDAFSRLASMALVFSLATSLFILLIASVPGSNMMSEIFLAFFPFFIAGAFLATVYKIFVTFSNVVYFVDLLGAATGALAVVFLLNFIGAVQGILLVSTAISIASSFLALASKKRKVVFVTVAGIFLMAFLLRYSNAAVLDIRPMSNQGKELADVLADQSLQAKIIDTRWSAFGRTDLVELGTEPHFKVIFVDGGAGTRMFHFDGAFNSSNTEVASLRNTTQYFPYYFANKGSSLIIGPGGGLDVLTSLMSGFNHTTAVEVNPDIVNIVRDYSYYDGGIYTQYTNVHVHVDEGRSFVKRSLQKYDIIMLDIPVTKTAQGSLEYALAENYLFTTNSFTDYLDRLDDDGLLAIVAHQHGEVYKLVSTAFKVLEERSLDAKAIFQQITIVEGKGHSGLPVFILKKTPFTNRQAALIYAKAGELGLKPAYIPYIDDTSLDPMLKALAEGRVSMEFAISSASFEMTPPTDNNPFFYKFEKGLPVVLSQTSIGIVVLNVALLGLYIGMWGRRLSFVTKRELDSMMDKFSLFRPYYFASLGLGFMLIEIPLIQKFILFLGQPTLSIAASLFSLMLSGGLGSFYSMRWNNRKRYNAFKVSLIIGAIVILYLIALPSVFNAYLSYDLTLRFFISFALMFPLGFLMGIPFPTGLRFTGTEFENEAIWMWCINGAFSVLGAVLALVGAMSFGYTAVLLSGGLIYLALFLVGRAWAKGEIEKEDTEEATLKQQRELEKSQKKQRRKQWKEELWKRRQRSR